MSTLTALYDTRGAAEAVRDALVDLGVAVSDITIRDSNDAATGSTGESGGFWAALKDLFVPDEDRSVYDEGVQRGGYLVVARVPAELHEQAQEVLESGDPIDLDERSQSWRESGWAGYQAGTVTPGTGTSGTYAGAGTSDQLAGTGTGFAGAGSSTGDRSSYGVGRAGTAGLAAGGGVHADTSLTGTRTDEDVINVTEEQLEIGKREVGRGKVRVRSYVTERPVEEDVTLREEHVTLERRPVNREVGAGDVPFAEKTIEAVERGEEAVVGKTTRIVEEVGLRKDVDTHTETVRDTVRRQDVEVEDERTGHGAADRQGRTGSRSR